MDCERAEKRLYPQGGMLGSRIYSLPGRLYETIYLSLTLGAEERSVKAQGIQRLNLLSGQVVLDWGCGTGLLFDRIASALGTQGRIIAVDRSPSLIRRAVERRRPGPRPKTCFAICDGAVGLCLAPAVDAAIACYSLGVMNERSCEAALREIRRVLRPGGKILIIDMYMPSARTLLGRAYFRTHAFFARHIFNQSFSGHALASARGLFRELAFIEYPSLLAFVWIGCCE